MPSPFPGMDPYLEAEGLWPAFHHQLVTWLYQMVLPALVDRYKAKVQRRAYADDAGQEHGEEYVEVRQRGENRLVTLLDVVSPGNKTTAAGRRAYLARRQEARSAGASLVEIDLVLQGQPMVDLAREGLPEWDYAVTVTRSTQPDRFEIYTATLRKRLPRFRLPLAGDDRDTVVDLQDAFRRSYDLGGFAARIDYRRDPPGPLDGEQRRWLNEWLRGQRLRPEPAPAHDEIARLAYAIWQEEGCPDGRADEHWLRAMERLREAALATGTPSPKGNPAPAG